MGKPLLAVIRDLALDPGEKAAFASDPQGYLSLHGYGEVTPDDLREAVSLAADTMDPQVAQSIVPPEGDNVSIVETLQRVTQGDGTALMDADVGAAAGNGGPGPTGPAEPAVEGAEGEVEASGPDLAFGAGSSGGVDFDDPDGDADGVPDDLDFGEPSLPEGDAQDVVFDSSTAEGDVPDDQPDFDEAGDFQEMDELQGTDPFTETGDDFQAADEFAGEVQVTGLDLPSDVAPDIGAF